MILITMVRRSHMSHDCLSNLEYTYHPFIHFQHIYLNIVEDQVVLVLQSKKKIHMSSSWSVTLSEINSSCVLPSQPIIESEWACRAAMH